MGSLVLTFGKRANRHGDAMYERDTRRRRAPHNPWLLLWLAVVGLAPGAAAAQPRPIPHEYFELDPGVGTSRALTAEPAALGENSDRGQSDGEASPTPAQRSGDGPPIATAMAFDTVGPQLPDGFFEGGVGGERNGAFDGGDPIGLDRETTLEETLRYVSIFEPSVAPWKRVGSRSRIVDRDNRYLVVFDDEPPQRVSVGGELRPDEERFVGRTTILTTPGSPVRLPTPGAPARVLALEAQPDVELELYLDSDGNMLVGSSHQGSIELTWSVAVPARYFDESALSRAPTAATTSRPEQPAVPERLRRDAAQVLAAANVAEDALTHERIAQLVAYFRAFESAPFPEDRITDNAYLDIALSGLGVCRQRTLAFVLTAQAIGVPARYVYNEAHTFAEVPARGGGWVRVDLGGATTGLEIFADADASMHDPGGDGALPRPEEYDDDYSANVRHTAAVRPTAALYGEAGASSGRGAGGFTAAGEGTTTLGDLPPGPGEERQILRPPPGQPQVVRMETVVTLAAAPDVVYRGDVARLVGRLVDADGQPPGAQPLEIYLGPPSARQRQGRVVRIDGGMTDSEGRFALDVTIPATATVGPRGIYVVFPGSEVYEPARSP